MKLKLNRIYLIVFTLIMLCGTIVLESCTSSYNYSQQLINAIENNDYDLFDELLKQGKNLDSRPYVLDNDRVNMPPLHFACKEGKYDFVVKLVEAGAYINNTDVWDEHTPLMVTLSQNNESRLSIAEYLIKSGADVTIIKNNYSALDYAFTYNVVDYSESTEILDFQLAMLLLNKGLSITDVRLGNVIFIAAKNNNKLMVEYLIKELNVNIDFIDSTYGNTALIWAVQNNCYNVAKYLIDNGANIDIKNNNDKTALDIAIEKNNIDILNLFK